MEKHFKQKKNKNHLLHHKVIFVCLLILCSLSTWSGSFAGEHFDTTYDKYSAKAHAGDTQAQNLLGYMNFYGEGAVLDYDKAHYWFHLSAEAGDVQAQRNLGLFHARAVKRIPEYYFDAQESNKWLSKANSSTAMQGKYSRSAQEEIGFFMEGSPIEIGEKIYQKFCAGCHGFNGIANFERSPSFAKGERLNKTERQLFLSIKHGKNIMPAWKQVLSDQLINNVVVYIKQGFSENSAEKLTQSVVAQNPTVNTEQVSDTLGAKVYERFCGGCHGFNGIAYYVNSPSFALGERMNQSDAALKRSISNGRNVMPGWGNKLSHRELNALVDYIRTLSKNFDVGIDREINVPVSNYFTFKPNDGGTQ